LPNAAPLELENLCVILGMGIQTAALDQETRSNRTAEIGEE